MTPPEYLTIESNKSEHYHFTDQVGHLLRKVYQRHAAIFQQNISDPQLTAVQFITLCAVRDRGPSSLTELVQVTAVDQATIRGIIERLKARQLITVLPDRVDRRKVIVGLTDTGNALLTVAVPQAANITELTFGTLNPAERIALMFLLNKMLEEKVPG